MLAPEPPLDDGLQEGVVDDTGVGTKIAEGVSALAFTYYQTSVTSTGTSITDVTGTPASATEVKIAMTMNVFNSQKMTRTAYVSMRNKTLGF